MLWTESQYDKSKLGFFFDKIRSLKQTQLRSFIVNHTWRFDKSLEFELASFGLPREFEYIKIPQQLIRLL